MSIKIASHLTTNTLWGASICNFIINFLPQVNLGLVLPICFMASFFSASMVMKTYKPDTEGTGSLIAWFYSNESTFASANLYGALGILSGLGLVMLSPSYKWLKGDTLQILSTAGTVLGINAFSMLHSMRVLDRDFKYGPYNKWDASMTYIWHIIPQIYIPVDYFYENRQVKEGDSRQLYKHPVYSWDEQMEKDFFDSQQEPIEGEERISL